MNINNPTPSTNPWATAPRTLTGLGTAITAGIGVVNQSLAAGSSANFMAPVGSIQFATFVGRGATNVTWSWGLTDGITPFQAANSPGGSSAFVSGVSTSTVGFQVTNIGTVAGLYLISIIRWNS